MSAYPGWPAPHFVETNGLKMAVHEAGPQSAKPPIVFCHGFPELAFSWRHQVRDLAARGYHVLAPDQRGYGLSPHTGPIEDFDMEHLVGDLIGLLDAKGIEKAVFCGHDWGGIVTWQIPMRFPDRVAGMIGVNTPFLRRSPIDPIQAFRMAFGDDMYIVHFQKPGEADAILDANVEKAFRYFMRRPGGGNALTQPPERKPGTSRFALIKTFEGFTPEPEADPILSPDELAFFVDAFTRTGFTGGTNWYRNFTRNWERSTHLKDHVEAPSLMIMAEHDAVLSPAMADGMEKNVPNLAKHLVNGSGHWTQQEKPEEVTSVIADWMEKTFPG
jgi:pimeloyl-ACP methyl ester carboxylesterase